LETNLLGSDSKRFFPDDDLMAGKSITQKKKTGRNFQAGRAAGCNLSGDFASEQLTSRGFPELPTFQER
jgi:hypothetical protein